MVIMNAAGRKTRAREILVSRKFCWIRRAGTANWGLSSCRRGGRVRLNAHDSKSCVPARAPGVQIPPPPPPACVRPSRTAARCRAGASERRRAFPAVFGHDRARGHRPDIKPGSRLRRSNRQAAALEAERPPARHRAVCAGIGRRRLDLGAGFGGHGRRKAAEDCRRPRRFAPFDEAAPRQRLCPEREPRAKGQVRLTSKPIVVSWRSDEGMEFPGTVRRGRRTDDSC